MSRRRVFYILVLALGAALRGEACLAQPTLVAQSVVVTYLGNEGFLLQAGETAVLIDALFGDGIRGYRVVPTERRAELEAALPPFDNVDLVLATHEHADHFDPAAVRRFLSANETAVFISTPQAVERLRSQGESFGSRVRAVLPDPGQVETLRIGRLTVRVFFLHHGEGTEAQNLGFEIELGGRRVLHVGDTEVSASEVAPLQLAEAAIDLALLPSWILTKEDLVREAIRPRRLGLMHVAAPTAPRSYFGAPGDVDGLVGSLREIYPDLIPFLEPGDAVTIEAE